MDSSLGEEKDLALAIAMSLELDPEDKEPGSLAHKDTVSIEQDDDSDEELKLAMAMSLQQDEEAEESATLATMVTLRADQDNSSAASMTMTSQTDAPATDDSTHMQTGILEGESHNNTSQGSQSELPPKRRASRRTVNTASMNYGNTSRISEANAAIKRLDDQLRGNTSSQDKVTFDDGELIFATNPLYTIYGNVLFELPSQLLHVLESLEHEFKDKPAKEKWRQHQFSSLVYFELYLLDQHDREAGASYMERAFSEIEEASQKVPRGVVPFHLDLLFALTDLLSEDARHAADLKTCPSYIRLLELWDTQLQLEGLANLFRPLSLGYAQEQLYRVYHPLSSVATNILERMIGYGEECYDMAPKIAQDAQWDKRVILLCYSKLERARDSRDGMSIADLDETIGYTTEELLFTDEDPPPPKDILLVIAFNAWLCRYSREKNAYSMLRALQAGFDALDSIGVGHKHTDHVTSALATLLDEQSQRQEFVSSLSESVEMALKLQAVRTEMLQLPARQPDNAKCGSCNQVRYIIFYFYTCLCFKAPAQERSSHMQAMQAELILPHLRSSYRILAPRTLFRRSHARCVWPSGGDRT